MKILRAFPGHSSLLHLSVLQLIVLKVLSNSNKQSMNYFNLQLAFKIYFYLRNTFSFILVYAFIIIIENRNKQMCLQSVSSVEIMQIKELKNGLIFIYLRFSVSLMIKLVSCVVHVLQYCRYDIHFIYFF